MALSAAQFCIPTAGAVRVSVGLRACGEGSGATAAGGTEAFIEVPILDDGDIEPAREFLRVRLLPGLEAESLGGASVVDLAEFFEADSGEVLSYAAESSDPSLALVSVEEGILTVTPNDDGFEGFVTVIVTATDADGLTAQASFQVEALPAPRPFASGWRLGWLKGADAADREGGQP